MNKITRMIRFGAALCCAALALSSVAQAKDVSLRCDYIPITGDGIFVADTLNGVEARYNTNGQTLFCDDLVIRYYRDIYGVTVRTAGSEPVVVGSSDLYFEPTDDPMPGDVLYATAAAREKGYGHWALVKERNEGTLTLIEQNWSWNGKAGINRVIPFPGCYAAFALRSRSGALPELAACAAARPETAEETFAGASKWAVTYLQQAKAHDVFYLNHDYTEPVTREDFCQMALNILKNHGWEITGAGAAGAVEIGLVSDGDGTKTINREEAACIADRLLTRIGDTTLSFPEVLEAYTDAADISDWAKASVAQMTVCGLLNGSNDRFNPKVKMTNEQAVTLMLRINAYTILET